MQRLLAVLPRLEAISKAYREARASIKGPVAVGPLQDPEPRRSDAP